MGGDDLCRTLVQEAGDRLARAGTRSSSPTGSTWRARTGRTGCGPGCHAGCDAWIVQREVQDVTQYAELWLRDAGDHRSDPAEYAARYDAWLDEFEARKVKAVGFGWITLRKSRAPPSPRSPWRSGRTPSSSRSGDTVRAHFERQDYLRAHDDAALLAAHFSLADEVVQEQVGLPGAEDPEHVVLRQHRGMRRATKVDTVGAGFAGVCDGTLSAGRILDAIAQLVGEDPVSAAGPHARADPAAGGAGLPGPVGRVSARPARELAGPVRRREAVVYAVTTTLEGGSAADTGTAGRVPVRRTAVGGTGAAREAWRRAGRGPRSRRLCRRTESAVARFRRRIHAELGGRSGAVARCRL